MFWTGGKEPAVVDETTQHLIRGSAVLVTGGTGTIGAEIVRQADLLDGKKLVIWEFVESDIRFGADGWKDVPLPTKPEP